jgi:membrane protease YdiL (CAAX protease family)
MRFNPPPQWPPPPPGWQPTSGWQPDPAWPPPPPGWQLWLPDESPWTQLDQVVAALPALPRRVWWQAAWRSVAATVLTIVAINVLVLAYYLPFGRRGLLEIAVVLELAATVATGWLALRFAEPIRDAFGGWAAALGWSSPRWRDLPLGLAWMLLQLFVRGVILVVLPHSVVTSASNTRDLSSYPVVELIGFAVSAVLLAPLVEETVFRGVLLRAGLQRWGFWPAAVVSSLLFGALHSYEAASVAGGLVLGGQMFVFGLLQCVLVRRTARLFPGVVTHASANALAVLLAGVS